MKNNFDISLLEILACPLTKEKLEFSAENNELISKKAGLAFPIINDIPILIIEKARKL
ncbi:MAG: Trm112 family protein [Rickettsiales bacterium]|nr:Trm112 family protein [Rickettsiales bacterium]